MDKIASPLLSPALSRQRVDAEAPVPPEVKAAAEGMEAMFIDYMMKGMRKTIQKSDMSLDSNATNIYQGMLDWERSKMAAKDGGIGLSELVIAYLMRNRYTGGGSVQKRDPGTGGTHEDRESESQ